MRRFKRSIKTEMELFLLKRNFRFYVALTNVHVSL